MNSANHNPFSLEANNKKFFADLEKYNCKAAISYSRSPGRHIRRGFLLEQSVSCPKIQKLLIAMQQLERSKPNHDDSFLPNFLFKKQKSSLAPTYRRLKTADQRATARAPRQSLSEFIAKHREICYTKMRINEKIDKTERLQDSLRDEQQTLKTRKICFKDDVELMAGFIGNVKEQAIKTQSTAESEMKIQQQLNLELLGIETQIERKENLIGKAKQEFESLKGYKDFIQKISQRAPDYGAMAATQKNTPKHSDKDPTTFLTQGNVSVAPITQPLMPTPETLLWVFNYISENNISEIQSLNEVEEALEKTKKQQMVLRQEAQRAQSEFLRRQDELQTEFKITLSKNNHLKEWRKNYNGVRISDEQDIDMDKVREKIREVYMEINNKKEQRVIEKSEIKSCMKEIQNELVRLQEMIEKQRQINPAKKEEIAKAAKVVQRQNMIKKQQETKLLLLRKQSSEKLRENNSRQFLLEGRKDMTRTLLHKKPRVAKVLIQSSKNTDQKYFRDQDEEQAFDRINITHHI